MTPLLDFLTQPFFRALEPETAHRTTIAALKLKPPHSPPANDGRLRVKAFGLDFPNPIGMAAGFDKNAEVGDALLELGFGFAEAGTITPLPQPGNPRPRLFRLNDDRAVINRFGFNSEGAKIAHSRLSARKNKGRAGIIGVNVGANKDAADRLADYASGIAMFSDVASYFTINISSPNTPGLRDLQQAAMLDDLLARVMDAREQAAQKRPILLKIAPDLDMATLDDIVLIAKRRAIDGMIVSNTTISRPIQLKSRHQIEAGGLSGRPLFALSTHMLAETFRRVDGAFPLIGVGGVDSAETAWAKIEAGATLIQLYSALVYEGVGLLARIKSGLLQRMERESLSSLASVVGRNV